MVARNPSCGCQSGTPFNPPSGCCAGCVCYPDSTQIVTACSDVPCLYDNYQIAGELPFGSDNLLSHDTDCDYSSGSFDVTICDTDYGMFHWELTVGLDPWTSVLTLVADGSNTLPVVYKSNWFFNPLCGNTFGLVFDCGLPPDIAHTFPCDLCIVADGEECDPCSGSVTNGCCSDPVPTTLTATISAPSGGGGMIAPCSAIDGQVITLTYNGIEAWVGTFSAGSCGILPITFSVHEMKNHPTGSCVETLEVTDGDGNLCLSVADGRTLLANCPLVSEVFGPAQWGFLCTCCSTPRDVTITITP